MLVLARKVGQRIMIGPDIVLAVVSIDRGIVRLGIQAPQDIVIAREEVSDLHFGRPLDHGRSREDPPRFIEVDIKDEDGTDGTTFGPAGERPLAERGDAKAGGEADED